MTAVQHSDEQEIPKYPKPADWLALNAAAVETFELVKKVWGVGHRYEFSTRSITDGLDTLTQPRHQAAFVLRRLQALYHVTTPGVLVDNAQGKSIALDLSRLLQELAGAAAATERRQIHLFAVQLAEAATALNSPQLGGASNERCIFV